jgi:hypothetical protein
VAGIDNLRVPTSEEAREIGRKGGIASAKARRKRKAIKETLDALLSMTLKESEAANIEEVQSIAALKGKNITVQEAILLSQIQKAIKGDARAALLIFEMLGNDSGGTTEQAESHNALIEAIRERNK